MTTPAGNLGHRRYSYAHGYMLSGDCSRRENTGTFDVQPVVADLIEQPSLICTECGTAAALTDVSDDALTLS